DPLGRSLKASYEWNEEGKTAFIEMAAASGLVLLRNEERNPLQTSSFGTGLLIKDAIQKGARKIILGLGGSATNDAGMGILAALGFDFFSVDEKRLAPSGESLSKVHSIHIPGSISPTKIVIACDVLNTLFGENGAAVIYAPQKGATPSQVDILDNGLQNFANVLYKETGKWVSDIPGTGAAGGIAAGLIPFFNVEIKRGIEIVATAGNIEDKIKDADLLITGEGKIDHQSKEGKVVSYIAGKAFQYGKPVIALCGVSELDEIGKKQLHITHVQAIMTEKMTIEESMKNAAHLIEKAIQYALAGRIKKEE
ncbi:MAG: glycerate kinase, partial [Bacteroidetes bacterium]|nr:glycerate kinase [Bacteroidota bacterium]